MLRVEIDEALMERLQAKAVAQDKPLDAVVIASLEQTALADDIVDMWMEEDLRKKEHDQESAVRLCGLLHPRDCRAAEYHTHLHL
jgi:phage pi2 protein 07